MPGLPAGLSHLVLSGPDGRSARGVELEQPPTHNERFGIHHAFLRDPDGHLIEVQRFDDTAWSEPIVDPATTGKLRDG